MKPKFAIGDCVDINENFWVRFGPYVKFPVLAKINSIEETAYKKGFFYFVKVLERYASNQQILSDEEKGLDVGEEFLSKAGSLSHVRARIRDILYALGIGARS